MLRKRSRISPIRSSTESGFGSTSRGALPLLLLDEALQRALEQVHGEVRERHVLGRRQLARQPAEQARLLGLALAEPGAERLDPRILAQAIGQLLAQELALLVEGLGGIVRARGQAGAST